MPTTYTFTITQLRKGRRDHERHPVRRELARQRALSLGLKDIVIGDWTNGNPRTRTWTVTDLTDTPLGPNSPVTKLVEIFNYFEFVEVTAGPTVAAAP
jgi:hypothetical protein